MAAYDYIDQSIVSTCLIEPKDIDSFYNPVLQGHTGFAWDGQLYSAGVLQGSPPQAASWFSEAPGAYRGELATFPQTGLVLLSKVALTIIDGSTTALKMWMQFLIQDQFGLPDNWNGELNGFAPSGLVYADGVLSVTYTPDAGNETGVALDQTGYNINSNMVVNIDFTQDKIFLDVAV
jgi:hypothetical protein